MALVRTRALVDPRTRARPVAHSPWCPCVCSPARSSVRVQRATDAGARRRQQPARATSAVALTDNVLYEPADATPSVALTANVLYEPADAPGPAAAAADGKGDTVHKAGVSVHNRLYGMSGGGGGGEEAAAGAGANSAGLYEAASQDTYGLQSNAVDQGVVYTSAGGSEYVLHACVAHRVWRVAVRLGAAVLRGTRLPAPRPWLAAAVGACACVPRCTASASSGRRCSQGSSGRALTPHPSRVPTHLLPSLQVGGRRRGPGGGAVRQRVRQGAEAVVRGG